MGMRGWGYKTGGWGGGGTCSFTATKTGGRKSFSHAEGGGGGTNFFSGSFYAEA